jgi:hypothetical protein
MLRDDSRGGAEGAEPFFLRALCAPARDAFLCFDDNLNRLAGVFQYVNPYVKIGRFQNQMRQLAERN